MTKAPAGQHQHISALPTNNLDAGDDSGAAFQEAHSITVEGELDGVNEHCASPQLLTRCSRQ